MLDDATSSLDNKVSHAILHTIKEEDFWNKKTFLMSTNNFSLLHYFDRVIFVDNGKIIHFGSPEDVRATEEFNQISIEAEEHNEVSLKK